ncbi:hypothetical protein EC957_000659 [Mortierella hygrophila]|uniref:Uncharacterized protein n=1 Tax=Mortierella hygrophila TaxID=979708 RepID=A0A9P6K7R1_9FUNG|nr:hypothetical protein EC957_000659 [Mortierella hygrophila]
MATETVIYVSLALVLLTRIYVFISPPEFLEQHKDRRYNEYHLYRQYHIRKQIDDNGQENDEQEDDDLTALIQSHSRRSSSTQQDQQQHNSSDGGFVDPRPLTALHYPSDELVLLGMGPGARPLAPGELSEGGFSKLENLAVNTTSLPTFSSSTTSPVTTTPNSSTTTTTEPLSSSPYSPRDGVEQLDVWKHIMGASDTGGVPSYLSLDTFEIHYNGSLHRFEKDPEVQESIAALKAGQRDMAKECPVMTVVWEGGRWCCLEGRTLYILRALGWKGQVRVRVLVDKDPTTLAVTEECWKAAGMTSDLTPLFTTLGRKSSISTTTPTSAAFESTLPTVTEEEDVLRGKGGRVFMSTATADPNTTTIGLSLEDDSTFDGRILNGTPEVEANVRFSLSNSSRKGPLSPSGSQLSGNDADVEEDEENGLESDDGYMEDDEEDTEEDETSFSEDDQDQHRIRSRLQAMSLRQNSSTTAPARQRQQTLTVHQYESENNSDLTIVSPPSPVFTPLPTIQLPSEPIRKQPFGSTTLPGGDVAHHARAVSSSRHHHLHHERKISIPDFMLPPPLHDEQVYLIIDPSTTSVTTTAAMNAEKAARLLREKNPPRRDSGHGDSP